MQLYKLTTRYSLLLCSALVLNTVLVAQEKEDDRILKSDPNQLLEISQESGKAMTITSLANFESREVREAPANVVVITARQIEAAGARNLYEALQLIPGFSFGRDVDDVIGVAIHGNWAEEGKCLFLLNGQQLNENDFGTYAIGDRVPLSNVVRIEVIQGPGSVMHGGYAALGVVNIVTRTADHGVGTRASIRTGYSNNGLTQTQTTISGSHRLSRDQEISYQTSHIRGQRSNALRLLPDSTLLNFRDSTQMQSTSFQFNYRWKQFKASMVYMEENFAVSDASYSVELRDVIFGLEYTKKLSRTVEVYWRVHHTDQLPWYYINTDKQQLLESNTSNQRTSSLANINFKPTKWLGLRLGVQGYYQKSAFYSRENDVAFAMNDQRTFSMTDGSVFTDANINGKLGLISGGARMEWNNASGQYFAPRIAYTKVLGNMHAKALWSKAFKIPTVMNLNYGPTDAPVTGEFVTTIEAELGYKIGKSASITANIYDTQIDNPIVYVYDDITQDNYINRNKAGTQGADVRFSVESKRLTLLASYGINRPVSDFDVPEMQLPETIVGHLQGVPTQQGSLVVAYDLSPSFTFRTRSDYRGGTWSCQNLGDDTDKLDVVEWPSELLFNLGITWKPKASTRLNIDLGCRNITDTKRTILPTVNNGVTPFALNGREFTLAFNYKFVQ